MAKEMEGKIGQDGTYSVDVDAKGIVIAQADYGMEGVKGSFLFKVDLIKMLETLCKRTDNKIDDGIVSMVKAALGR